MAAANIRRSTFANEKGHYEGKVELVDAKMRSKYTPRDPEGIKAQPQNVASGKVFIFGGRDLVTLDDEEDEREAMQTRTRRPRRGPRKHSSSQFIEEDIEKGATVQSIAIRYGCTVSEVRRLNNLYSDLDFHGLTKVKIPIKAHSLLTEDAELERRRSLAKERSAQETDANQSEPDYQVHRLQIPILSDEGCEADEETVDDAENEENGFYNERESLLARIDNKTVSFKSAFRWKDPTKVMFKKLDEDLEKMREKNDTVAGSTLARSTGFNSYYDGQVQIAMPVVNPMVTDSSINLDAKSKFVSAITIGVVVVIGLVSVFVLIFFGFNFVLVNIFS